MNLWRSSSAASFTALDLEKKFKQLRSAPELAPREFAGLFDDDKCGGFYTTLGYWMWGRAAPAAAIAAPAEQRYQAPIVTSARPAPSHRTDAAPRSRARPRAPERSLRAALGTRCATSVSDSRAAPP